MTKGYLANPQRALPGRGRHSGQMGQPVETRTEYMSLFLRLSKGDTKNDPKMTAILRAIDVGR